MKHGNIAVLDPAAASTLFQSAAPDLGDPSAVWFEGGPEDGIVRWRIRTPAGAFRLKVAMDEEGRRRLRTNVAALTALARAGLPVPEVRRFVEDGSGLDAAEATATARSVVLSAVPSFVPSAVIETRGAERDAATEWARLSRSVREAVVDRWAEALARLHQLPPAVAGLAPPAGRGAVDVRDSLIDEIAFAVEAPRVEGLLPGTFLRRVELHLCRAVDRIPANIAPAPCHGRPRLASVLLQRGGFAAIRDFERARATDPVADLAHAALALGDPGGGLASRFVAAYGAVGGAPADLDTRMGLHIGLELLRCVTAAAADATPEVVAAILDGLESWLDEGVPSFP